MAEKKVKK